MTKVIETDLDYSNLDTMFYPNSVAIIGASNDEKKLGSIVLKNIIDSGFKGDIFPLNLKESSILGLKVYKDYHNLPITPDLAMIAIPSEFILEVLDKIIKKGTKNVVIFSAGFKEAGEQGAALEEQLLNIVSKNKINLLGPNCLGFVNNLKPINATFGKVANIKGNLRFLSQSGAIASSVFDWAQDSEIGFSEFVTLGNKTNLNENHILRYFLEHDSLSENQEQGVSGLAPIGMYLESIIDGNEFIHVSREISKKNPIFVLKPGKSNESKEAMKSHTGSIAGEDYIFEVALKKAGIIRCDGIEDFFDLAKVFSWEKVPTGKNIAIVSNAGGPAVLSSDFIAQEGLKLVRFDQTTRNELESHLPRASSILNPVDVLGDALAQRYESAIKTLITDKDVDSLLVILTPQVMTQIEATAEIIGRLSFQYGKPIFCSFMGGSDISKGEKILNKFRIPSFRFPERAVRAIAKMSLWDEYKKSLNSISLDNQGNVLFNKKINNFEPSPESKQILANVINSNRKNLESFESNQMLKLFDIKTPVTAKCKSLDDAKIFVKANNFPVVLKISSPTMLHKSDDGGVVVGISSDEELTKSFEKLQKIINEMGNTEFNSIQIQQQVSKGIELIIGSKKDSVFGNVLMFGAGGVLANLIEDRNLGLMPLSKAEIIKLIKLSKANKLIDGYRGDKSYDIDGLVDLIIKFQNMILSNPEILESDINPVILNDSGIWAVDGKIILT